MTSVPVSELGNELYRSATDKVVELLSRGGLDPHSGRRAGAELRSQGLLDVPVERQFFEVGGDGPYTQMLVLVLEELHGHL